MSKIITVWGSPNSGKTAISVKLAEHICRRLGVVVTVVCTDMSAPALPVLFPNRKADDMFSLGAALSKPEVTQHEILKNTVTVKGKANLGFLGFTDSENRFSYPAFDSQKAEALFTALKGIADVVIADCASDIQNALTVSAMTLADTIIRVANPDLKSISFFSSQLPLLGDPKYKRDEHIVCLNEINTNSWDDIAVTTRDGEIVKLTEHFHSPGHAVDIVKRLLHHSGMIIDNTTPVAQGHLPGNTRVTALKEPVVDKETGIACSIRLLRPNTIDRAALLESGFATAEMLSFLEMCVRYGVSLVIAGATSSGKTTLLNVLLQSIPDTKRIFSIESGSRELSAVRRKDGRIVNNVVHTLSRPSDNPAYDISQEDTPERHISNAVIKAGLCGLLVIPAFFIFPLITPVIIALGFMMYFKEAKSVQVLIAKRREAIERELPRLVFAVQKTLMHSRNVLGILESYKNNAGAALKYELNITVADMRSGNYESALTRLESRVGSAMLSDVVRGLISVLRGDETDAYWATLSVKFTDVQRQHLKQQAQKAPGKVKRLSISRNPRGSKS